MADIFISYSSEDKTIVKQIALLLEDKGWSVWWDRQIPIGQKYDTVIEAELQKANCVLVVWTRRSIASEWVKNEASEAANKGVLVPVVLEQVELPLAFKRIESAMLIDWNGEQDHPELDILFHSIENIISKKAESILAGNDKQSNTKSISTTKSHSLTEKIFEGGSRSRMQAYTIITITGFVVSLSLILYYLKYIEGKVNDVADQRMFYLVLILFGIAASALVFGVMNTFAFLKGDKQNMQLKMAGPGVGVLLILLGGFYLPSKPSEKIVNIRVFDWKKNPITQGDVKIYLKEYIRTQSIDKMGQALFTGIPGEVATNQIKIEVSSPGYATKSFDTLLANTKPLELILPLTTVVIISGKVKTAAEMPIKNVEINVDGTRYYAMSITDGSYSLRLEEYTLGDEITVTTSHKDFEDKTFLLRITAPEVKNEDIFLNPIAH